MTDPSRSLPITRGSVAAAQNRIKSHIHRTPVLTSSSLNAIVSVPQTSESLIGTPWDDQAPRRPKINLFFKCENFQKIGAFKIRGASHALSRLSKEELGRGVVTHSSGNHAQALALAASRFDTTAHIVMPTISTPSKIAATKGYGATVYFSGSTSDDREAVVRDVMDATGAVLVPPYDHPDIILGQGTMALELEEQVQAMVGEEPGLSRHRHDGGEVGWRQRQQIDGDHRSGKTVVAKNRLDAVVAPLGGGGMLAGVATALEGTPTRVYGAEPSFQGADDGRRGLEAGARVTRVSTLTIADGLRTPVGEINWTVVSDKEKVRGVFAVTEEQIKKATKLVLERLKVFVEPSACVGLAVVMFDEGFRRKCEEEGGEEGWDVGIILSGGNVSVEGVVEMFKGDGKDKEGCGKKVNGEREEGVVGLDGERKAENVAG